jgi:GABA permease
MWLFPWLSIVVSGLILAILASMLWDPTSRVSLLQGLAVWAIILIAFGIKTCREKSRRHHEAVTSEQYPAPVQADRELQRV